MTERHIDHLERLSNGCRIEVHAKILRDGSLQLIIDAYKLDGATIVEGYAPAVHHLDMEAAMDLAIEIARRIGNGETPPTA